MEIKYLIEYIKIMIIFGKKFINQVKSNNLLIFELQKKLAPIQLIVSSQKKIFNIYNLILNDGYVCSFYINKTYFSFDYTNINSCIENIKLLRRVFKNIYIYCQIYKYQTDISTNLAITYIQNSYTKILDLLVEFKNSIGTINQPNSLKLYTELITIICDYKSLPYFTNTKKNKLELYYFKINDTYEKIKFITLDLVFIDSNICMQNYISSDSEESFDQITFSDSEMSLYSETKTENSEQIIPQNQKIHVINSCDKSLFILFKKNRFPKLFYDNFIFKIGSNKLQINQNSIGSDDFVSKLNIFINTIRKNIDKIQEYTTHIENYLLT